MDGKKTAEALSCSVGIITGMFLIRFAGRGPEPELSCVVLRGGLSGRADCRGGGMPDRVKRFV